MEKEHIIAGQKPRYEILDGLRGVAALIVVAFHLFEAYSPHPSLQIINHGYLAVDFFFALSGFVIGYAYDDRWSQGMTTGTFFVRRLIRLQPMVFAGATFGMLLYFFGAADIENTSVGMLLAVWLLSCFLIPTTSSFDIRGWGEGYALDGPQWSLAFEYIANILYALFIRRFPRWLLVAFVCVAALLSLDLGLDIDTLGFLAGRESQQYTFIGGWSLDPTQLYIGFIRLLYPFFAGLLVYRLGMKIRAGRAAFALCSVIIIFVLAMPRVGLGATDWTNGLYEALCVLVVFPVVLMIGSGSNKLGRRELGLCRWLGRISYPLYITHYPLIYMAFKWRYTYDNLPLSSHIMVCVSLFVLSIGVAVAFERLYDMPVRKWLAGRLRMAK